MTDGVMVTPSVRDATNFKEFFLQHDGLNHVCQELAFSVFKRYICKAGCKMCYLQNDWIADEQFGAYVPKEITPEIEAQLSQFFTAFRAVGTYDDVAYLKKHHPALFDFYRRNDRKMVNTSMTDVAFIQQHPILMTDLHFAGVYEITFSDTFLSKKQGRLVYDVVDMLRDLNQRSPLVKLKVIRCMPSGETSQVIRALTDFAHEINIPVGLHDEIIAGENNTLSTDVADYQERNYHAENSEPMQLLSEITYVQYTGAYMTLIDTVDPDAQPFFDVASNPDLGAFLAATLIAKRDTYARYARSIRNTSNNKMYDYFKYVVDHLGVNPDHNFIPRLLLKPWITMYGALLQQGWVETPHGLIKPRPDGKVIPILTLSDTPRPQPSIIPILTT